MADLSDLFLVLPGGVGTLDEALEMITWYDVGLSRKPSFFVDVDGFWRDFAQMMAGFGSRGVLRPDLAGAWRVLPDVSSALEAVATWLTPRAA
jgi:predicted Rossmann-fold nucleotide-binding protein